MIEFNLFNIWVRFETYAWYIKIAWGLEVLTGIDAKSYTKTLIHKTDQILGTLKLFINLLLKEI